MKDMNELLLPSSFVMLDDEHKDGEEILTS